MIQVPLRDFCVRREDLSRVRWLDSPLVPEQSLAEGELLLRVDRFGLSVNNVTYGQLGVLLRYWDFFPAPEGWGRVPVWGYADVVASRAPEIREGERIFGYLPMSRFIVVRPESVTTTTFRDGSAHRRELPPVYQQYSRTQRRDSDEDMRALLRPVFGPGYLLDDWLADNALFGAQQVILSSASSKTALAAAYSLSRRRDRMYQVVGLTSPRNRAFCEALGYYDRVLEYSEVVSRLASDVPTVYVDLANDEALKRTIHTHFADALRRSVTVGATHRGSFAPLEGLPGPAPQLFLAPDHVNKRIEELGPGEVYRRLEEAQEHFFLAARRWLEIVHHRGERAIEEAYLAVLGGKLEPRLGMILSLSEPSPT